MEQNLVVRNGKSQAEVTNKRLIMLSRYYTVGANYRQKHYRHIQSRGLSATAELLVCFVRSRLPVTEHTLSVYANNCDDLVHILPAAPAPGWSNALIFSIVDGDCCFSVRIPNQHVTRT